MLRVCITGGAGFIGSHLTDALLERGDQVTILDRFCAQVHPGGVPAWLDDRARLVVGDVNDPAALTDAMTDCEVVFHLAAETGTGQSMYELSRYVETNVGGTAALLEAIAALQDPPLLVLASSRAIYGEGAAECAACGLVHPGLRTLSQLESASWEPSCPRCGDGVTAVATTEDAPGRPASIYGVTKLAQEELLRVACEAGRCRGWALRFQNVFGSRQCLSNPYTGLLAVFSTRTRQGLACELFEDGNPSRDFVHVRDVVDSLLRASVAAPSPFHAVNIGSGQPTTVREVASRMSTLQGGDQAPVVTGRYRAGDIRHAFADITLAGELLDWVPRVTLTEGLEEFLEWGASQEVGPDQSEVAQEELKRRGLGK